MIYAIRDIERLRLILRKICFNIFCIDIINDILYKNGMRDDKYFLYPLHDWQRRYETLRASFVERLPAKIIAERFGYSQSYIHLLRHQFIHGKIDLSVAFFR